MSMHYRRSPLVQGGIEIPWVVTMSMPGTVINQLLMERYRQLVETLCTEPKKRGNFWDILAARPRQATKKPETKKPKSPNVITID